MNRKSIIFATTLATASAAVALPTISLAATQRDGLQACVNALTGELSANRASDFKVLLDNTLDLPGRRLGATEVFHLDARSRFPAESF